MYGVQISKKKKGKKKKKKYTENNFPDCTFNLSLILYCPCYYNSCAFIENYKMETRAHNVQSI